MRGWAYNYFILWWSTCHINSPLFYPRCSPLRFLLSPSATFLLKRKKKKSSGRSNSILLKTPGFAKKMSFFKTQYTLCYKDKRSAQTSRIRRSWGRGRSSEFTPKKRQVEKTKQTTWKNFGSFTQKWRSFAKMCYVLELVHW